MSPVELPRRVLGIDHGTKRVGLAVSDLLGLTAHALEVVPRHLALDRIAALALELEVTEIVIGLPTSLGGKEGPAADAARAFAREVEKATHLQVTFVDERFTTTTAERALLAAGMRRRERRQRVDKVAAAVILQAFLDQPR
ncbi:MAG TPA: Holliday junction resolvase RuvX [Acidimicrobiia bacterium]